MKIIKTKNGDYLYEDFDFSNYDKFIDKEIAKENLLLLKKIFDKNNVKFGLIYGTLLGAVRDKDFISHDKDTDIFVLYENMQTVLDLLFILEESGFKVGRFNNQLLSLFRKNEYIDIYFFKKKNLHYRECDNYIIKKIFLENLVPYDFLGEKFLIPNNAKKLLIDLYGKDWKIPKKNSPATNYNLYLRIKLYLRDNFNILFRVLSFIKRKINV